jgi:hypothetical protein
LNILFFEKDEMKFVFSLEKELNIKIDFANSIDDIEGNAEYNIIDKLDKHSNSKAMTRKMRVDNKASE